MGVRATVGTVVVLGVLAGGAVLADRLALDATEDRLAGELHEAIPGLVERPGVTVEGFPFLTQVLAGELSSVRVTAREVTVEGLGLEDVRVHLTDVTTDAPHTAGHARLVADVDPASLSRLVPVDGEVTVDGEHVVVTADVLGVPVDVLLEPSAAGRQVRVAVVGVRVALAEVSADDLPASLVEPLQDLRLPVDGLPDGVELTDVTVADGVLTLTAEGDQVTFEPR